MTEPTVGQIVHYRLTRQDVKAINRRYVDGTQHYGEHREKADGSQVHAGNQHTAGQTVPLLIVRVWENEFSGPVAPDWLPGDESPEFHEPLSGWGVNGQAFLDGNDSLWCTSIPHGDFIGGWNWPTEVLDDEALMEARADAMMVQVGVLTRNEVRAKMGLPPLDEAFCN